MGRLHNPTSAQCDVVQCRHLSVRHSCDGLKFSGIKQDRSLRPAADFLFSKLLHGRGDLKDMYSFGRSLFKTNQVPQNGKGSKSPEVTCCA